MNNAYKGNKINFINKKKSHCVCKKDYRFELVKFILFVDKLDGSVDNCLRVVGILRCLERKD